MDINQCGKRLAFYLLLIPLISRDLNSTRNNAFLCNLFLLFDRFPDLLFFILFHFKKVNFAGMIACSYCLSQGKAYADCFGNIAISIHGNIA